MGDPGLTPEVIEATEADGVFGKIRVPTGKTFIGEAVSPTFSLTVVFGVIVAVEAANVAVEVTA